MEKNTYKQINYNSDDFESVSVYEVSDDRTAEKAADASEELEKQEIAKRAEEIEAIMRQNQMEHASAQCEEKDLSEVCSAADDDVTHGATDEGIGLDENKTEDITAEDVEREVSVDSPLADSEVSNNEVPYTEPEKAATPEDLEDPTNEAETSAEETNPLDEIKAILAQYAEHTEKLSRTMARLDKRFNEEILNAENRDNLVKTIYKELNDYKSGLIEKALKNVLYDVIDLREVMLSQIKYLKEKKGVDTISLDELESYANDMADILERHDVTIYKGEAGQENVAVRQKIVKKVETEDETMVKKVAESISYGYEYNSKVIYPEKIHVYVKKR